jgi:hypothetical protein
VRVTDASALIPSDPKPDPYPRMAAIDVTRR